ncbi:MAG: hypothetical protein WA738_21875 [Candidatus Angelobacter sp.]
MRRTLGLLVFGSIIALASITNSHTSDKPAAGSRAVGTLRLVNTAEAYAHGSQGKFLPLAELVSTGALKHAGDMNSGFIALYNELSPAKGTELLSGYDFALLVSSDGSAYKMSMANKERCGQAFFTDERGLIYAGKVLDCSK